MRRFVLESAVAAMIGFAVLTPNARAAVVGRYDANAGVTESGGSVTQWADQIGTYNLIGNGTPEFLPGATPIGTAAIDFNAAENDALAGTTAVPTGFPLAGATALTAAVVFNPDNADMDNDPVNMNFWGHPQLASGDQGGGNPDWGFSWGPDGNGVNRVWFGVGENTGSGTPTATAAGADPGESWYVAVGTWGDGEVGVYLYAQDGSPIDSSVLATPNATVPRVDVGFSTAGERPNINARSFDGQIAAIELLDNTVDDVGALQIATALLERHLTGSPALPGDVNGDNVVDIEDYRIIRDNLHVGRTREEGNLDLQGVTDLNDFRIWKNAFEMAPAAVPEPGGLALACMALGVVLMRRRMSSRPTSTSE